MKIRRKNKKLIHIFTSITLIILGLIIIGGKHFYSYLNKIENEKKIEEYFETPVVKPVEVIETKDNVKEEIKEDTSTTVINNESYIAVLEIPKINLKRGIYAKNSKLNNVDKNIYLLKESNMPDEEKGNFILAAHSGSAYVSYFRNLPKLSINDIAYVYYNGGRYGYKLVNNYEIIKNGKANIIRNGEKNTMTLITCKHNTDKQLIYIFELMEDE